MAEKTIAAGFKYLWYGTLDSSGLFIGSGTAAPAAGTAAGSGMARLIGARTMPIKIPDPVTLTVLGDDERMVSFQFDSADLPNGVFEMSARDNTFEALVMGTLVETVGDMEVSALSPANRANTPMCMLLSRRAKSALSGSFGAHKWENLYISSLTIMPLFTDITQREFSPYRYSMNCSSSDRTAWSTISTALHGTTGDVGRLIDSDNPLHVQRFTGNGVLTTFTLNYPPVSAAKTKVYVDDLLQAAPAVSGVSVIPAVLPGSGARVVVIYEVAEADLNVV